MSSIDGSIRNVLAANETAQAVQIAYLIQAKALDAAKQQGEAVVQLIEEADLGKAPGCGDHFDAIG